ncbi:MAG: hypothetical protein EZS28_023098 [Streblomastix strix]|uniref:Uncharacterized protein n=1 Tax=Streblomastix strix TaxID=222440 RepID=A0A5J4VFY4_9EUKA|nr:MAG: hypothetical protein EZS28_023098 [Streblomastix strix]
MWMSAIGGTMVDPTFATNSKSKIDAVFAKYEIAQRKPMDENGINSLFALKEELQQIIFIEGVQVVDIQQAHEIIIFDVESTLDEIEMVPIPHFKKYPSFH